MSTINKKISQTDYEIIGDTQGLLIPSDTPYVKLIMPATTTPATQADTWATFPAVPANSFVEQLNATTLTVKQKGLYYISAGLLQQINDAVLVQCLVINGIEARWQNSDAWNLVDKVPFVLVELDAGATIRFKYRTSRAETISTYQNYGFIVAQLKQQMPYMVVNKGALVSDNAIGKGKIDDDGTMSINGELGIGSNGSKVSINRPDKWNPGIEYDFGDNVRGIRFTGTWSTGTPNEVVYQTLGDDTVFKNTIGSVIQYGGHLGGCTNHESRQFAANCSAAKIGSNGTMLENLTHLKTNSNRGFNIQHKDAYAAFTTNYDVWALYVVIV
jgi:hypothetical protein